MVCARRQWEEIRHLLPWASTLSAGCRYLACFLDCLAHQVCEGLEGGGAGPRMQPISRSSRHSPKLVLGDGTGDREDQGREKQGMIVRLTGEQL